MIFSIISAMALHSSPTRTASPVSEGQDLDDDEINASDYKATIRRPSNLIQVFDGPIGLSCLRLDQSGYHLLIPLPLPFTDIATGVKLFTMADNSSERHGESFKTFRTFTFFFVEAWLRSV